MEVENKEKEMEEKVTTQEESDEDKFDHGAFIDTFREVNNEVLQMEEIRSQTEKLKLDLISYLNNLLKEYDMTLKISTKSLSSIKGLLEVHLNNNGIITYHFKDGSIESSDIKTYPPTRLLVVLNALMPHLKTALKKRRKDYEDVSSLLSKVGKNILILEKEPEDWPKQHSL